ncbi:MAG: DUF5682 family protein [Propionibacteriaceae bacterium]|nr:DUF5682 family protein [Propionibacteriaceae bacterium]
MGEFRVFGVRHHGPGSARSLVGALDAYRPDAVLIEGPIDGEPLLRWVPDLRPPVALFAYETATPKNAAFWPFAVFSPEWQALAWAAGAGAAAHLIDLPAHLVLAQQAAVPEAADAGQAESDPASGLSADPFSVLAGVAGVEDPERWWDEVVESVPAGDRFAAVAEMMGQLRAGQPEEPQDLLREAHMRCELRKAVKRYGRVAVVCGAYHGPALAEPWPTLKADQGLLKGLPKAKSELAWVPWTHSRLAAASGYGAGVRSPGWYHHLFTTESQPVVRWLTKVAAALRGHDLPVSSAHVIEAARLAETLAALRDRSLPGLGEVSEAVRSVMCAGDETLLAFVNRELVVGEELGSVPPGAPSVPLEADLRASAKRLRLAFSATEKEIALDLRKDSERSRSALLHRLAILGIDWGRPRAENSTGTFKEGWTLAWDPEFAVKIVEAATWGTTVAQAAANRLNSGVDTLAQAGDAIEQALLADLTEVLEPLLVTLDARAAAEGDVEQLLASVPPLARSARYGTVRGTDTSALRALAESVLVRACAGLAPAVAGLDEEAADHWATVCDDTQRCVGLLSAEAQEAWSAGLLAVADRHDAPPLLAGRSTRLLFDAGALPHDEVAGRLSRALSAGWAPPDQAGWVQGLLFGDALLLIHDQRLLGVLNDWVGRLEAETFTDVLPLVRRAFGSYSASERRHIEQRVLGLAERADSPAPAELDLDFSAAVLRTVRLILGRAAAPSGPDSDQGLAGESQAEPSPANPGGETWN